MSRDAHGRVDSQPGDRECSSCLERDKEIRRLRDKLAATKGVDTNQRGFGWWCLLFVGICVLALAPHLVYLLLTQLETIGNDTYMMLAQGVLYGVPVSQYAIVGLFMALHWRPQSQRLLYGVAMAIFFGMVAIGPYVLMDEDAWQLVRSVAPLVPIAMVLSTFPLLVQRALFRWTIALRGQSIRPMPVTLSSFLMLIGLCGLAIACLRLTDLSLYEGNSTLELVAMFLIYVGVPATTTGFLFAVFLPTILQPGGRKWTTWVLRLILILAVTFSGLVVLCLTVWALEPDDTSLDMEMIAYLCNYCFGLTGTTIVVAIAAFFWMRLLGYHLLSIRSDIRAVLLSRGPPHA